MWRAVWALKRRAARTSMRRARAVVNRAACRACRRIATLSGSAGCSTRAGSPARMSAAAQAFARLTACAASISRPLSRMSQFFRIHPDNPQPRLIAQAVQIVKDGGVLALPTDSSYALACRLDDKAAVTRLRRIRGLDERQNLSLIVRDLSELANFAMVDNRQFRLIKSVTPGPYVFVLQATKEVPRRLSHPSRKTIGVRVPDHAITLAILAAR